MSNDDDALPIETLKRQVAYFRDSNERLGRSLLRADAAASTLRHELEQKRRGIALLASIMASIGPADELETFRAASLQINPTLNMQRTVVLMPVGDGFFRASIMQGYDRDEADRINAYGLRIPAALIQASWPIVVTRRSPAQELAELREWLDIPYLVATPVSVAGEVVAILITGRSRERHPFMPSLSSSDAETIHTIGAFLGTLLSQKHLTEVEHLANHDPLTGLPNLRLGHQRLLRAVETARRDHVAVAVLYIDLDGFKRVNDSYGHKAGDSALREVGRRMRGALREKDTVARIGGDEFMVVVADLVPGDRPTAVVEKLLVDIRDPIQWRGRALRLGASIGMALFPEDGDNADTLLSRADRAMYVAKASGRNERRLASRGESTPMRRQPESDAF